jgi:uncharacterized membrane protein
MLGKLRMYFINGLLVLLPLIVTIYILNLLYMAINSFLELIPIETLNPLNIPGLRLLIALLIVLITGLLATNIIGRKIISLYEKWMEQIPVVKDIYKSLKQIAITILSREHKAFKKVVLIEYPKAGIYTLGFATGDSPREITDKTGKELVYIFIPTSPNPTSGMLVQVPKDEVIELDISANTGLKMIVSGGLIVEDEEKSANG